MIQMWAMLKTRVFIDNFPQLLLFRVELFELFPICFRDFFLVFDFHSSLFDFFLLQNSYPMLTLLDLLLNLPTKLYIFIYLRCQTFINLCSLEQNNNFKGGLIQTEGFLIEYSSFIETRFIGLNNKFFQQVEICLLILFKCQLFF